MRQHNPAGTHLPKPVTPPRWKGLTAPASCALGTTVAAGIIVALAFGTGPGSGLLAAALALAATTTTMLITRWAVDRWWSASVASLSQEVAALGDDPRNRADLTPRPDLTPLIEAIRRLRRTWHAVPPYLPSPGTSPLPADSTSGEFSAELVADSFTRSGIVSSFAGDSFSGKLSGDFTTTDMVNRLEPRNFRWIESSPAEQAFLGWELAQLREMAFLEIVHPDDYPRVRDELQTALAKGEIHGLVLRVRTARGKPKAIVMNVSVRYGPDLSISHLRCHITDVTAKVRAERELRLRTRELTQVNEQLRHINRELEELKDRYRDLYQNAPAMYFSLDERGCILDCNDTLLATLGYRREEVAGRSFERFLTADRRSSFAERFAETIRKGWIEAETQWVKANGDVIDVWVSGTAVWARDGSFLHSRSVAQDVTARHRLEAELREKNERLARTNEELSRKNKEMDEFTYVVSHDLQEPLRTLIAFSDFLLRDCGEKLDDQGHEYVNYLVAASRRMRALIHDLLTLSRAGRVTADFAPVNLDDVMGVVKADLAELIRGKGAELRVQGPLPVLWGDRDRIGQLMANLVGNGLKYNESDAPWVEVGALDDPSAAWTTLYVRDNGIGIDPEFHERIFQLFRRLHPSEEYEGTGAGLAICHKITQAHGGKLWVESEPDQGATFYVKLRRLPPEEAATAHQAIHAS